MTFRRPLVAKCVLCVAFFGHALVASPVHAQFVDWQGVTGDWGDGANWLPTGVPGPFDIARFGAVGTPDVELLGDHLVGALEFTSPDPYFLDPLVPVGTNTLTLMLNDITSVSGSSQEIWNNLSIGPGFWQLEGDLDLYGGLTAGSDLFKSGAGTLTLRGDLVGFSHNINVQDGELQLLGALMSPSTHIDLVSGSTLVVSSPAQIGGLSGTGGNVQLDANLSLGSSGIDTVYGGDIGGTSSLIELGPGKLTLTATNTYSGGTTIKGGVLSISADGQLGSGAVSIDGGLLGIAGTTLNDDTDITNTINFASSGGGFDIIEAAHTFTYASKLTHAGPLLKSGPGMLALTGDNTYSGGTTINDGTLSIATDANLGYPNAPVTFQGGTLRSDSLLRVDIPASRGFVTNGADAVFETARITTVQGGISGDGGLVKTGGRHCS